MTATAGRRASPQPRRNFYGIAEIADALGLSRQLVTVWRRRRSHGIPEPTAELSSGPIWRGETIEPWIDEFRASRDQPDRPLETAVALRACRRVLRLAALLLEEPPRIRLLSQALSDVRELRPVVAASTDDNLGPAVQALLAPVGDGPVGGTERIAEFRGQLLAVLPLIPDIVHISGDSAIGSGRTG
ncbi:MAG: helix-turn-helix transcriptional regulator [Labedaea sp.]